MIGFRADANKTIATGHIMRCMTIADALVSLGEEVKFYVADEETAEFVKSRDFAYEVLDSDWNNPEGELETLAQKLIEDAVKTLVCDSYSFTKDYFNNLKCKTDNTVKIVYMDDLCDDIYPVDMLINYNAYAHTLNYEGKYDDSVQLLLGPMYAPLRPQFAGQYSKNTYGQRQVLIASGGGDPYGVCLALMEEIAQRKELMDIDFYVVAGGQTDSDRMVRLAWCSHNIFIEKNVTEMAKLMSQCDVAISAAGTMLTELCAMKVPAIEYVMADNQQQNSDYYTSQGLMIDGGDVREDVKAAAKHMVNELCDLLDDDLRLMDMKKRLAGICDGQGATRIAKEIVCC